MVAGLPKASTSRSCRVSGWGNLVESHQRLSGRDVSLLLCASMLRLSRSDAVHTPDHDILTEDETTRAAPVFGQSVEEYDPMPTIDGSTSVGAPHQTS